MTFVTPQFDEHAVRIGLFILTFSALFPFWFYEPLYQRVIPCTWSKEVRRSMRVFLLFTAFATPLLVCLFGFAAFSHFPYFGVQPTERDPSIWEVILIFLPPPLALYFVFRVKQWLTGSSEAQPPWIVSNLLGVTFIILIASLLFYVTLISLYTPAANSLLPMFFVGTAITGIYAGWHFDRMIRREAEEAPIKQKLIAEALPQIEKYRALVSKYYVGFFEYAPVYPKLVSDLNQYVSFIEKTKGASFQQFLQKCRFDFPKEPEDGCKQRFLEAHTFTSDDKERAQVEKLSLSELRQFLFSLWKDIYQYPNPESIAAETVFQSKDSYLDGSMQALERTSRAYGEELKKHVDILRGMRQTPEPFRVIERTLDDVIVTGLAWYGFQVVGVPYPFTDDVFGSRRPRYTTSAAIYPENRFNHCYCIGATGSGKTHCLKNLISQDIQRGAGVIVLSPERELCNDLLHLIPPTRAHDLIYFDPTDTTEPLIGFNPFEAVPRQDLVSHAGEVYTVLERAAGGDLGQNMDRVLRDAVTSLYGARALPSLTLSACLTRATTAFGAKWRALPTSRNATARFGARATTPTSKTTPQPSAS